MVIDRGPIGVEGEGRFVWSGGGTRNGQSGSWTLAFVQFILKIGYFPILSKIVTVSKKSSSIEFRDIVEYTCPTNFKIRRILYLDQS
jgi:hypothetical protein